MSGAQRELGIGPEPKVVTVTRDPSRPTVELMICDNGVPLGVRKFNPAEDAAKIADVLLDLPVETRRAFYTLLTQEMYEGFNAAPRPEPRYSPPITPSARRRRR